MKMGRLDSARPAKHLYHVWANSLTGVWQRGWSKSLGMKVVGYVENNKSKDTSRSVSLQHHVFLLNKMTGKKTN